MASASRRRDSRAPRVAGRLARYALLLVCAWAVVGSWLLLPRAPTPPPDCCDALGVLAAPGGRVAECAMLSGHDGGLQRHEAYLLWRLWGAVRRAPAAPPTRRDAAPPSGPAAWQRPAPAPGAGWRALSDRVVAAKEEVPGVALATMCDVPAAGDGSIAHMCERSVANKAAYATSRGYALHVARAQHIDRRRAAPWHKLLLLGALLSEYLWVVWLDLDTVVVRPNFALESVLGAAGEVHQVLSSDENDVNTGVWAVRGTAFGAWLLDELWAEGEALKDAEDDYLLFHYEQRALHHVLQTRRWQKAGGPRYDLGRAQAVRGATLVLPGCALQGVEFQGAEFVVHLAGMRSRARNRAFDEAYAEA